MNTEDIWNNFISKIKSKVSLMTYNYIFTDLKLYSYEDSKITIIVPNDLVLQNINKNYLTIIEQNNDLDIVNYKYNSNFNPKYTFDTFVVGDANKLAYGTALSVAQNPGKLYNPYFIYAKSGLGKTHLMHAIGNYIVTHSDKKVLYITAEQFTNDYRAIINAKNKATFYNIARIIKALGLNFEEFGALLDKELPEDIFDNFE